MVTNEQQHQLEREIRQAERFLCVRSAAAIDIRYMFITKSSDPQGQAERARGAAPRTSSKFSLVRKKRITQHYQRLAEVQARIRCRHAVEFSRVRRTASIQQKMFDFHLAPVRCGCFKVANQLTHTLTHTSINHSHIVLSLSLSTSFAFGHGNAETKEETLKRIC